LLPHRVSLVSNRTQSRHLDRLVSPVANRLGVLLLDLLFSLPCSLPYSLLGNPLEDLLLNLVGNP
jgi:hypothetical protein